ncbi:hypothetical protein ACWDV4_18180 [Micromonospora sp. NPDC003197]
MSANALGLVARTATAVTFGEDEAGRRYRKNYEDAGPQLEAVIRLFGDGLAEVGGAVGKLLGQLVDADDPRAMGA